MKDGIPKDVLISLLEWKAKNKWNTDKRCLAACRYALQSNGIMLPMSGIDYNGNLAIDCFNTLAKNPGKWGWMKVSHPLTRWRWCLVFFKNCGTLADGRVAGHIAILDTTTNIHYSNSDYTMNSYWNPRLIGAFVPKA